MSRFIAVNVEPVQGAILGWSAVSCQIIEEGVGLPAIQVSTAPLYLISKLLNSTDSKKSLYTREEFIESEFRAAIKAQEPYAYEEELDSAFLGKLHRRAEWNADAAERAGIAWRVEGVIEEIAIGTLHVYDMQAIQDQEHDLNSYRDQSHQDNAQWWEDGQGNQIIRNKGELLILIVSEIVEAMEGERKDLMDDKLPHRKMAEVELADALIRIFDYAGGYGYDLEGAYQEKREYNASREDHKHGARAQANGKKW